jgi:hypothetical protein
MNEQQRATVIQAIEDGASLRKAAEAANLGSEAAIRRLVLKDSTFATQYTRARDLGLDKLADEVIEIADDQTLDPNSRRVMMDARRWYLSKLAPKRYGERVEHSLSITHDYRTVPTEQLEMLVAQQQVLQLESDGTVTGPQGGTSDSGEPGE